MLGTEGLPTDRSPLTGQPASLGLNGVSSNGKGTVNLGLSASGIDADSYV